MSVQLAGAVAGAVSTALFVSSYLPMLAKAWRTRDMRSYSPGNLIVANVGNVVHTLYVVSLPVGPIWALHGFYLVSTAVMLCWWLRYGTRGSSTTEPVSADQFPTRTGCSSTPDPCGVTSHAR